MANDAAAVAAAERELGDLAPLEDFVTWSEWALARVGFRPSNALALVALCRDELMSEALELIEGTWGRAFQLGSLAGLVLAGRTGLRAALAHVPGEDGRHRFVVFCLPHVGVDADGRVGSVQRRGMYRTSTACGALAAVQARLVNGESPGAVDPDDVEFSLLHRRLAAVAQGTALPTLAQLTDLARRAAVDDVRRHVSMLQHSEPVDVAYIGGIVVHLPDGSDHVARVDAEVVIDQIAIRLPH
jgi:hypothetical protein